MAETQKWLRLRSSSQSMFVYTCTTLSRSPHWKACVKPPLPELAYDYPSAPCTHAVLATHQYKKSRAFASCTTH